MTPTRHSIAASVTLLWCLPLALADPLPDDHDSIADNAIDRIDPATLRTNPQPTRSVQGGACVVFSDQAEFEAFNTDQGRVLNGIEDFEESIIFTTIDGMDDPLCGGIPNSPDGFPFPNGLDEEILCLQSNFEHYPALPNPRGVDGLAAAGAGFLGLLSDIVLSFESVDSLDLMFGKPVPPEQQDIPSAVGFNPISIFGRGIVEVRVYNTSDDLLTIGISPADEQGQHFWGVSCSEPIGRINIHDPADGFFEGGDYIQMWGGSCDARHVRYCDLPKEKEDGALSLGQVPV